MRAAASRALSTLGLVLVLGLAITLVHGLGGTNPFTPAGHSEPWATLYTKKPASLDLFLFGPKNMIGFGRFASLAWDRDLDATRPDRDVVRLRFLKTADLKKGDLREFLREHLEGVTRSLGDSGRMQS